MNLVILPEQKERLDRLFLSALLDPEICHRLVVERDEHLLYEFGVAVAIRRWMRNIPAVTLTELAHALVQQDFIGASDYELR